MRKLILFCTTLCAMVLSFSASPVQANVIIGWVSINGSDTDPLSGFCVQTHPCRTIQGAISKGFFSQINCLETADYGAFTVTTSIVIDCGTGNVANIFTNSGTAITINTTAAAIVVLRHLNVNGNGTSSNGIDATNFHSGTLIVEDCMIQGFPSGFGVYFRPNSGRGTLNVSNSQSFNNASGITVAPATGRIASVTVNQVELLSNSIAGLQIAGSGIVAGTMRNSVSANNAGYGVVADAGQVYFTVDGSSIVNNLMYGIQTNSAGSFLKVGASTIGGNGTGVKASAGSIVSFGNNQMSDNGSNGNFTSTAPLQ